MPSIEYMRNVVESMYNGPGWARKVANMSDGQVMAIYIKQQAKAEEEKPPKKDDTPF